MSKLSELAAEFSELIAQKARCSTEEKDVAAKLTLVESALIEEMADEGVQNFKLENGPNLYRKIDKFYGPAEGIEKADLVKELAAHPQTMDLVENTFNSNSLRARMKEIEANGETIPEELQAKLKVFEKHRIGYRS